MPKKLMHPALDRLFEVVDAKLARGGDATYWSGYRDGAVAADVALNKDEAPQLAAPLPASAALQDLIAKLDAEIANGQACRSEAEFAQWMHSSQVTRGEVAAALSRADQP